MKSPADLSVRLAKQWHQASTRVERLLSVDVWPLRLPIGKPSAREFAENTAVVQKNVQRWQEVTVGEVQWELVNYRAGAEPVRMPRQWLLRSPSEWVSAANDSEIAEEYALLEYLVENIDELFHPFLVRERAHWLKKAPEDVILSARLAKALSPGCAGGRPLRLLADYGVDTKFFERNKTLITRLLDERFEGAATEQGLSNFLDALEESHHWLLLVPLTKGILPFKRMRVTTSELAESALPCSRILVIENEQCIYLLPELEDTVAILGAGLHLQWLQSRWLSERKIAYWGDMDSWGLLMLARARQYQPNLIPILMSKSLFKKFAPGRAVNEPVIAQQSPPTGLNADEAEFYQYLVNQKRGRLEQEYLPKEEVEKTLCEWIL